MDKSNSFLTAIKLLIVSAFVALTAWLGNLTIPVFLLLALMVLDYFTAWSAAKYRGEKLNSDKSIKGIFKKCHMLVLIILGVLLEILIEYSSVAIGADMELSNIIAIGIALWLTINEIISVLENIKDILGDKVPKWLTPLLEKVRSKIEDKTTPDFCKDNPESEECKKD